MTATSTRDWDSGAKASSLTVGLPDGDGEPWLALPPGGRVRLLVPRNQTGLTADALEQLLGHRGTLTQRTGAAAARLLELGAGSLLPRQVNWDRAAGRLLGLARRVADRPDATGVIRCSPGRPNTKPVVQLLDPGSRDTLAYVKIGWDPLSADLVRHETTALERLELGAGVIAPDAIGHHDDGRIAALAITPVHAAAPHGMEHVELARFSSRIFARAEDGTESDLASVGLVRRVREVLAATDTASGHRVARAAERLLDRYGDLVTPVGRWHGDLNPANVLQTSEAIAVIDWERSTDDAPVGLDAAYAMLRDRAPAAARSGLVEVLGRDGRRADALLATALLVVATRHVVAVARGAATAVDDAVDRLSQALP